MNIQILSTPTDISEESWASFVEQHPKGAVFQSTQMYRAYQEAGEKPHVIVAKDNRGNIVGVLESVLLQEKGIKGILSKRCIITGGPLAINDDKHIISALLDAHNKYAASAGAIYSQIRNMTEQLHLCDVYRQCGYTFEPHLNFLITTDDEDMMWQRIGKGRKKQIRKAQAAELKVDVYTSSQISDALLHECFSVIKDVYKRANLPLADESLVAAAHRQELLTLFVVRNSEGEILGCRFGLAYKQSMFGWYAGSYDKYYKLYPNDLLIWETLRWCRHNGYTTFDYGGAGSPNKPYGVREFKAQMGGELVCYGRYENHHRPLIMGVATLGYKLYKRLLKF